MRDDDYCTMPDGERVFVPRPRVRPDRIQKLRKSAGLTQTQAAALLGRKLRIWQHWEAGTRDMPQEMWELFKFKIGGQKNVK